MDAPQRPACTKELEVEASREPNGRVPGRGIGHPFVGVPGVLFRAVFHPESRNLLRAWRSCCRAR
jgi:hypothetical protein